MSMVVARGRLGYTNTGWRRDRVHSVEKGGGVLVRGDYEAYQEDLRKRKGIAADQPHRVAYKKLVRA